MLFISGYLLSGYKFELSVYRFQHVWDQGSVVQLKVVKTGGRRAAAVFNCRRDIIPGARDP
ncbi:MAG TPA: hypothetical protein VGC08_02320, partial [Pedobacter sp.]